MSERVSLLELELAIQRTATQLIALGLPSPVQRLMYRPDEAAAALGVSGEFFAAHVRPELKLIRRGRLVLVPVAELEKWVATNGERTLREGL